MYGWHNVAGTDTILLDLKETNQNPDWSKEE